MTERQYGVLETQIQILATYNVPLSVIIIIIIIIILID
jgi:hypothetical protein